MKKILFSCLMLAACLCVQAQTTTQILDRAAAVVGRSGGCSAAFTLSHPQTGKATGNIQIKGQKFHAVLGEMEVWFNGKTQWVYQASTEEVSISNPSAVGRQQMNPYTFIRCHHAYHQKKRLRAHGNTFPPKRTACHHSYQLAASKEPARRPVPIQSEEIS